LFARTMLNAMATVSVGMIDVIFIQLANVAPTARPQFLFNATIGSSRDALYAG
jgi:hypothetical protein